MVDQKAEVRGEGTAIARVAGAGVLVAEVVATRGDAAFAWADLGDTRR